MVQRSDLTDFLIAPLQHQCHYQLLLEVKCITTMCTCVLIKLPIQNVLKATSNPTEKSLLTSAIKAFAVALSKTLFFPIHFTHFYTFCAWLQRNSRLISQLTRCLSSYWSFRRHCHGPHLPHFVPTAIFLRSAASYPCTLVHCQHSPIIQGLSLEQQPCQDQLAISSRQLLDSGLLRLIDNRGRPCIELHGFLFTDMILFAEPHSKHNRRDRVVYHSIYNTVCY